MTPCPLLNLCTATFSLDIVNHLSFAYCWHITQTWYESSYTYANSRAKSVLKDMVKAADIGTVCSRRSILYDIQLLHIKLLTRIQVGK